MLVIRLSRTGRKNRPMYRIVVQEKSQAPKAGAKEILGSYNPHVAKREEQITLDAERIKYWLSVGAQPSSTIHNLCVEMGIIESPKRRSVQPKKKATEGEGEAAAEQPKEEAAAK